MTREEIFAGLREVMSVAKPKLDLGKVTEASDLVTDLEIDSLSMLLLSLAIENRFQISLNTQKPFRTVGEVIDYIAAADCQDRR